MASSSSPSSGGGPGLVTGVAVAAALTAASRAGGARRRTPPDEPAVEPPERPDGGVKLLLWRIDDYQRTHAWLGFPIGVGKKFGQDKAGFLAALVAYFGFFSLFPLMLAFTSIVGYVVPDPAEQEDLAEAAASQIPVVGSTIREQAGSIQGSVLAIVIGSAVALWAGLKIVDAMQNAMNDVWDVPRTQRPNIAVRRARSLLMLGLLGGGLVSTVVVSNLANFVDVIPGAGKAAIWAGSATVSILLYWVAFQLLTDTDLSWRHLFPGAVFGGLCWWALQTWGSIYVVRQEEAAGEAFGQFASIIALMAFLFLAAQLSILGAEIGVVKARRLWPRSLVGGRYTEADLRAFEYLAASTKQDDDYDVEVRPRTRPEVVGDPTSSPASTG